MTETDAGLRTVMAKIADGYDLVPYKPQDRGSPGLDPALLFGIAGLYGDFPLRPDIDVLDIGCGTGGQLRRVGGLTSGRLVGVDISPVSCAEAARKCADLGPRCAIHCKDLFELEVTSLGQFDLIYVLGVYFVVPPPAQARLMEVLKACLKPGGVLVISYYTGEVWRQFDAMRRAVQAVVDRGAPAAEQIKAARTCVRTLADTSKNAMLSRLVDHSEKGDQTTFFHEMMGEVLSHTKAAELEAALAPAGIHFLNLLQPGPFASTDPMARASAADRVGMGGYLYGVFGRFDPSKPATWDSLSWITGLRRAGVSNLGIAVFQDTATGARVEVSNSTTAAALDLMARGPRSWSEILTAMAAAPAGLAYLASVKRDFTTFWHQGHLTPLALI